MHLYVHVCTCIYVLKYVIMACICTLTYCQGGRPISTQNSRFIVYVVMDCIVQEVKYTLLYCLRGRPVSMQNSRFIVCIIYLLLHGCGCIINKTGGKRVNENYMYLHVHVHYPGRKQVYSHALVLASYPGPSQKKGEGLVYTVCACAKCFRTPP